MRFWILTGVACLTGAPVAALATETIAAPSLFLPGTRFTLAALNGFRITSASLSATYGTTILRRYPDSETLSPDYALMSYPECAVDAANSECVAENEEYATKPLLRMHYTPGLVTGVYLEPIDRPILPPPYCVLCTYAGDRFLQSVRLSYDVQYVGPRAIAPENAVRLTFREATDVPEPSVWALLLGGIGAIGARLRYRTLTGSPRRRPRLL